MPRKPPKDAEKVILSPEDAAIMDFFVIRRSFNKDGTIRYVQAVGLSDELEAFAAGRKIVVPEDGSKKTGSQKAVSLPRLVAQRMLGRPLMEDELVVPINGKNGDCRRSNLEMTTPSEVASRERSQRSSTGTKYVYSTGNGRFYVNINNMYLGTFDTPEQASDTVDAFHRMIEAGMSEAEAARRLKGRARGTDRVIIQE